MLLIKKMIILLNNNRGNATLTMSVADIRTFEISRLGVIIYILITNSWSIVIISLNLSVHLFLHSRCPPHFFTGSPFHPVLNKSQFQFNCYLLTTITGVCSFIENSQNFFPWSSQSSPWNMDSVLSEYFNFQSSVPSSDSSDIGLTSHSTPVPNVPFMIRGGPSLLWAWNISSTNRRSSTTPRTRNGIMMSVLAFTKYTPDPSHVWKDNHYLNDR